MIAVIVDIDEYYSVIAICLAHTTIIGTIVSVWTDDLALALVPVTRTPNY
jgi:hypothetical protein